MQTNAYAHYHNFILLVDPRDCKDKASWVFPPPSKCRFYVIGGNHSALARMELLAQYLGIYTHYRHCNCIVYACLSKIEASLFTHDENFDLEESIFRKWERKELKSMKGVGKGKKKDDGEMRQTWWRPLQGVFDERKLSILLRVDVGELSLDQMTLECARCKTLDVIIKAFCHLTGCKD
ncbi:hypothetical protein R1sor_005474 [Riccia sorocarpa]|uniref:Uncharacterized protein n=1 Tax=Riccia sorocarpa TaxID=122646 RepID=A0ABD3HK71_9MARC